MKGIAGNQGQLWFPNKGENDKFQKKYVLKIENKQILTFRKSPYHLNFLEKVSG